MRFVFYTHSLVSDWNHGNAHFLRGIMRELNATGHETLALEPENGWSRTNLIATEGPDAVRNFTRAFPSLSSQTYGDDFDHAAALSNADVVIVHEWTDPALVAELGRIRRKGARFLLAFHDTHHRAVSADSQIADLDLQNYDLILAFGEALRELYLKSGWGRRVVTWHEAADTHLFKPQRQLSREADLVWIGNWGDGERSEEIQQYLVEPVRKLGLKADVYGVRYPDDALRAIALAGMQYHGWLPNTAVPQAFARHRMTVHIPRRPYVEALPGIPTIRVFEALACGIPLVSAPWEDVEGLFRTGMDFLVASGSVQMENHLRMLLHEPDAAIALAAAGLETILQRHTCAHRVQELLQHLTAAGATISNGPSTQEAAE